MWERPSNIPYPNVWYEFEAKDIDSGKIVKYRIQDLPKDRFDDGIQHMIEYYAKNEQIIRSHGL